MSKGELFWVKLLCLICFYVIVIIEHGRQSLMLTFYDKLSLSILTVLYVVLFTTLEDIIFVRTLFQQVKQNCIKFKKIANYFYLKILTKYIVLSFMKHQHINYFKSSKKNSALSMISQYGLNLLGQCLIITHLVDFSECI